MPGLVQKNVPIGNASSNLVSSGSVSANGIWSKHRTDITFDQLQKFWSELSPQARQDLLRIDKHTLFEQARKNLYCSRCNGLLLEGFTQIVMYGKSLQQEGTQDEVQDPSVHPWGGLAATRDGILTLLDSFIEGRSLTALQNVFDSARARERERELLYPDACGGGGRGWISQGMASYGRGHGTRETCALHTARLSCDTLVDFWSALGDETRHSLLRMKEEDFIERLMYRFDSKRFCRDCRRNVIREFKELKELKRMRREPRCTNWFCVADTAFQYEVSIDTVQADWQQSFSDTVGTYHHFEWAVGTGEGKSDILEFENVGMNGNVHVNGLDLGCLSSCFITLRAWRLDGRCTELSVKAHALKGQPCVHRRLIVGDGFVTITKGESIRRFFEHAEEAEEEEDDDSMDKDGNDPDGDSSRPQKHAKSPELAREFLLDAATVIFKDQVEKAFREGTARQNAHSIFVCLALKLLEERVHVACKEIITLEKQIKLLEEEEKEKREEEERKERRRTKEREKKLRRKERLKGKDRKSDPKQVSSASELSGKESCLSAHEEQHNTSHSVDSISETGDVTLSSPVSSDNVDAQSSNGFVDLKEELLEEEDDNLHYHPYNVDDDLSLRDSNGSFMMEQSKSSRRKLRFRKDSTDLTSKWCDRRRSFSVGEGNAYGYDSDIRSYGHTLTSSRGSNGMHRPIRNNTIKSNPRNCGPKFAEKFNCNSHRVRDRYESHSCSCNQHIGYRPKDGTYVSVTRSARDFKTANKLDSGSDMSTRPFYRSTKFNQGYVADSCAAKAKITNGSIPLGRGEVLHIKKVWEPTESRKRCPRSNSAPDVTLRSSDGNENAFTQSTDIQESVEDNCSYRISDAPQNGQNDQSEKKLTKNSNLSSQDGCDNGFGLTEQSSYYLKSGAGEEVGLHAVSSSDPLLSSSSSDNCSSCPSEGDSSTGSSGAQNAESSCTSDSEDTSQHSEIRETSTCTEDTYRNSLNDSVDGSKGNEQVSLANRTTYCKESSFTENQPLKNVHKSDNGRVAVDMGLQQLHMLQMHNQSVHLPPYTPHSAVGYYHQTPASWTSGPTTGLVQFPQPNRYLFTGPLGYGLSPNRSSHFPLQYGATLQPVATPVLNVGRIPLYSMANKANSVNCKDHMERSTSGADQEASNVTSTGICECPLKVPFPDDKVSANNGREESTAKTRDECSNFSLFHFGGPVAMPVKDEFIPELSKLAGAPVQVDRSCSEKDISVEEYSLFAASNGSKFPFF
ncbi:hypothetical protein H6P81_004351 [Aristolochia fimbriata]|uniref:Uncharacterized protein n=1 Tax=Aristolochia fimbriata TaxID=158543 RepID=A0AAV7FHZ4_ARIFI|nr:hypothetical protein H6P81_004351 [Aristolochia fimbriata]